MDWKEKLNLVTENTEEEKEQYIFTKEIDHYFKQLGFYNDTMNPRFFDGYEYGDITENAPVLRFDGDWDHDNFGVQRVFMNATEIYVERQTSYRSFAGSDHYKFETPSPTFEEIEEALNKVVRKYEL